MSMDYTIYLKDPQSVSSAAFEAYTSSLGFDLEVHPEQHWLSDTGFTPIRMKDARFAQPGKDGLFLTGFETWPSPYEEDKEEAGRPRKGTRLARIVRGSPLVLDLRCSMADSFEPLMAYLFGAYCVKCCGGVFHDHQIRGYYDELQELEQDIALAVKELIELAKQDELLTHPFEGWK